MPAAGLARVRVGICSWADPALIESGTFYPKKSMNAGDYGLATAFGPGFSAEMLLLQWT